MAAFTLVVASAFVAAAGACLPDLPPFPAADAALDAPATVTALSTCGDGIIATLDDGGDAGEQCDPGNNDVPGCQQCQISCGGVVGPSGHCYFLADPTPDYASALRNCESAAAHVVTIDSDEETALVRTLVEAGAYRVGLDVDTPAGGYTTPNVGEPGWPIGNDDCPGCYARGADDAGAFAPAVDAGALDCLVADESDRWRQIPCGDVGGGYATVCEREPVGQRSTACGGPLCATFPATAGRKRYVISLEPSTADEAAKFCADFDGGALVAIDSNEEREQLARELKMLVPPERALVEIWVGLTRTASGWAWDDGSDASPPWAEMEPSPDAGGRAFMRLDAIAFDTQLLKTDDGGTGATRIVVCQRRP